MPSQIKSNSLTKSKCWNLSHRFFKCIENEFNNDSKLIIKYVHENITIILPV